MSENLVSNLRLAAQISRVILVVGDRQHDVFVIPNAARPGTYLPLTLGGLIESEFKHYQPLSIYEPSKNSLTQESTTLVKTLKSEALIPELLAAQVGDPQSSKIFLVNGEFWFEDAAQPRANSEDKSNDFEMQRAIEHFARNESLESSGKLLLIRVPHLRSLPNALCISPYVRIVNLQSTSRDERLQFASLLNPDPVVAKHYSNLSDGWKLTDLSRFINSCRERKLTEPAAIEAAARAFRIGVSTSPWEAASLTQAIKDSADTLGKRVRGQAHVIDAVCSALRKAGTGLAGAHQGSSKGPRATLFFAGPTGTGKTEMARALAELVFGDESAIIRFDCAEFRQDHSVARLIGAPPGYVGFSSGGELTEKVRARPHSVILMDEIEKAHPRMLDIFLSVIDDGRLTDGQGVTTRFEESILIFTSNLGIYEDTPTGERRARFDLEQDSLEMIIKGVRAAIKEEFVSKLHRPELLGRMGGEQSILVFDFIRDIKGVVEKFLSRLTATVNEKAHMTLTIEPAVVDRLVVLSKNKDSLVFGARGIAQVIESQLTTPISDLVFISRGGQQSKILAKLEGEAIKLELS